MHRIVVFFVIFISLSVFFTSFTFFNKDSSNLKNNEYFDDKDEINYFIDFILTNKGLDNFIYNDSFKIKVKKLISDNIIFTNNYVYFFSSIDKIELKNKILSFDLFKKDSFFHYDFYINYLKKMNISENVFQKYVGFNINKSKLKKSLKFLCKKRFFYNNFFYIEIKKKSANISYSHNFKEKINEIYYSSLKNILNLNLYFFSVKNVINYIKIRNDEVILIFLNNLFLYFNFYFLQIEHLKVLKADVKYFDFKKLIKNENFLFKLILHKRSNIKKFKLNLNEVNIKNKIILSSCNKSFFVFETKNDFHIIRYLIKERNFSRSFVLHDFKNKIFKEISRHFIYVNFINYKFFDPFLILNKIKITNKNFVFESFLKNKNSLFFIQDFSNSKSIFNKYFYYFLFADLNFSQNKNNILNDIYIYVNDIVDDKFYFHKILFLNYTFNNYKLNFKKMNIYFNNYFFNNTFLKVNDYYLIYLNNYNF